MNKKILSLLLIFTLVLSSFTVASAEGGSLAKPTGSLIDGIAEASGADGLAAIGKDGNIFLDLRAKADCEATPIKGAVIAPVCNADYSVPQANKDAFIAQMGELDLTGKTIYLSCYMGTFCVDYAIDWLVNECGVSADQLRRVTGGTFTDPDLAEAAIVRVPATQALNELKAGNGIIIDVRANEVHDANGYVEGAIHQPLFTYDEGNKVTTRDDDLSTAFTALIDENAQWEGKNIFVLCNSGSKGAAAATYLLVKAGIPSTRVFTIQGGAGSADIQAVLKRDYNFKTGAEALEAQKSGAVILDVRSAANHGKYTVAGSISAPLFGADGAISAEDGELATNFTAFVKGNTDLAGKDIYVLCNSGSRGAQLATKLLLLAGYPAEKINTITNGAKDLDILDAAIGNDKATWDAEYQNFVAGKDAVAAVGNSNIVILDVRATEVREKDGALKGSIGQPLFTVEGKNSKVTALDGELAKNFAAFVRGNKDAWSGKEIYILCNGGQSGARAALKLLLSEGFSFDGIKVIKGGAGNEDVKAALEPVEVAGDVAGSVTGTVQTGDASTMMIYVGLMLVAAVAVIESKKRLAAK